MRSSLDVKPSARDLKILRCSWSMLQSTSHNCVNFFGCHCLRNFAWVAGRINTMKSNLGKNEFIEICKLVVANHLKELGKDIAFLGLNESSCDALSRHEIGFEYKSSSGNDGGTSGKLKYRWILREE